MKNIMVGLSGGVDSAVAAFLLKKQGYDVAGATFRLLDDEYTENEDAARVADFLGIPFYVFDFRKEFRENVIDNFLNEYKCGRTPNPCVQCNKFIKFPLFLKKSEEIGYDFIATGHYARTDGTDIFMSKNRKKDQSYMLYNLTDEIIPRIIFPISDLTKDEVRNIAADEGIPVADKPDSQDICFIPDGKTQDYLCRNIGNMECGNFVDMEGNVIAGHKGIFNYTVGQHKGLGISTRETLYVKEIHPENNIIVLSDNEALYTKKIVAHDFNWIHGVPSSPVTVNCKIRYAHTPAPAVAGTFIRDDKAIIIFDEPQRAATPGQSVVVYDGDRLLGGGIIE